MATPDKNDLQDQAGPAESDGPDGMAEDSLTGLLFETSPYGNMDAIVQHDDQSVYFYLHGDESFGTRACWVRNLAEAPYVLDKDVMQHGLPPMMPRTHSKSPDAGEVPKPESLRIVWFEEGNAAALFEHQELIAVIPPWSGTDGFHGYSAQCVMESPLAWPLVDHEQLTRRIGNAQLFWEACGSEAGHPFAELQPRLLEAFDQQFGERVKYFALDGGAFPPRGAAIYRQESATVVVSVGMSFRPQPNVEMAVESPAELRRIELGLELPGKLSEEELTPFLEQISGLVAYPWQAQTWFGPGHTCRFPAYQKTHGEQFDTASFVAERTRSENPLTLPDFRDDPVELLWLMPVKSPPT